MEDNAMGSVIRRLRTARGWTQETLAEQLHLTPQSVSRWETGQSLPDVSQVPQLARVFGVTTDALYGLDQQEEDEGGPELVLSLYSSVESAPTYADWSRLASLLRAGDPGTKRSTVRWTFLSLALELADPGSTVYLPEKAEEVASATLELGKGFPEADAREAWGIKAEYRRLLSRLYALRGDRKAAFDILGTDHIFRMEQHPNAEEGEVWRLLGDRQLERGSLNSAGVQAVHFLLDTLYACGDNALAVGKPDRALEAADMALRFSALAGGTEGGLTSLQGRERGDLWGLKARALAALGQGEKALDALEEMVSRRLALLTEGEERVENVLLFTIGQGRMDQKAAQKLLRARLLRELGKTELLGLTQEARWKALYARADALGAE